MLADARKVKNWLTRRLSEIRNPIAWLEGSEAGVRKAANGGLESEQMLRILLNSDVVGIILSDRGGRILICNGKASQMLGYAKDKLIGLRIDALIPDCLREAHREQRSDILSNPNIRSMGQGRDLLAQHKDGTKIPVEIGLGTMDIDGEPFVACFFAEITDRKRAEIALRINLERLQFIREIDRAILAEQSPRAIAEVALAHIKRQIPCQRASVVLFDFETDEMEVLAAIGITERPGPKTRLPLAASGLSENLLQGDIEVIDDLSSLSHPSHLVQTLGEEGLRSSIEVPLAYKDVLVGSLSLGSVSQIGFSEEQIEIAREVADLLAITIQQARLFEQVRAGRDRMRRLTHQLVEAQEAERKHIARELHDEIGQLLTGLKLTLDTCRRSLPAEAAAILGEADKIVSELVDHLRKLSLDLRPAALDDLGLLHALLRYFERYTARTKVEVEFEHSGMNERFSPDIEIACYRIVQEALTNVARHAGVGRVTVSIHSCGGMLRLEIEDEGSGFDTGAELAQSTSCGLVGMRERAIALGGQLTIDSAPGIHTRLMAEFPVDEQLEQSVLERVM